VPEQVQVDLPNVRLTALTWGPADGPLALLLHGFPDTAYSWRHLGPVLAADDWRVVAPFTRGYAPSAVPADGRYDVGALMADAVALHSQLGGGPDAVLVGHDWGAFTANALAAHRDSPFAKVVAMSVPPAPALRSAGALPRLPRQLLRSWYMAFNQLPVLPERLLEPLVAKLWRDWSSAYDASEDLPHVYAALAEPAHRRAAIGYYRALTRPWGMPADYRRWHGALTDRAVTPTLYLHGRDDGCLGPEFVPYVGPVLPPGSEVHVIDDAGHFVQLEQPEVVNGLVRRFLAG
jgi:pimeloyl-ACP methyl ester carboxylesterase